jgi:hypothetical protein
MPESRSLHISLLLSNISELLLDLVPGIAPAVAFDGQRKVVIAVWDGNGFGTAASLPGTFENCLTFSDFKAALDPGSPGGVVAENRWSGGRSVLQCL